LIPSVAANAQIQARFERDYMSLAECRGGEKERVEITTSHQPILVNHHG